MTEVAPITDEELARLEADCLRGVFETPTPTEVLRVIARLRAAEARSETAEREMGALVAKVHEVYEQGHSGPLWKVREWMNAHVTGAKNEGKGG